MKGLILFLSFFAVGIFIAWADDQAISPSEVKQRFDIRPMYADVGATRRPGRATRPSTAAPDSPEPQPVRPIAFTRIPQLPNPAPPR